MSDEFESINSRIPDLGAVLAQRIATKSADTSLNPNSKTSTVDPYQLMLQKKRGESSNESKPVQVTQWPQSVVKQLEDYCAEMEILGFNCGLMHPLAALAMLKQEYGEKNYKNVPLEERIPKGSEKIGTPSGYGPNYPYSQAMNKKVILHG